MCQPSNIDCCLNNFYLKLQFPTASDDLFVFFVNCLQKNNYFLFLFTCGLDLAGCPCTTNGMGDGSRMGLWNRLTIIYSAVYRGNEGTCHNIVACDIVLFSVYRP